MELKLNNGLLEIRLETFGAELVGLRDLEKNMEYMWQKDPKFWAKCSPILFPFVGALKENRYFYNGEKFDITTRHGFARDNEFVVSAQDEKSVEFLFESNESTKKIYPFDFKLYLKYVLEGKKLRLEYRVENLGDKKMYFSLGAHPAFSTPLSDGVDYSDYYVEFEKEESGEVNILNGLYVNSQVKNRAFDGKKIVLNRELFAKDALIVEKPNSHKINLKNDKTGYNLSFSYEGFKYIAFWNVSGAEYVCLEPWCGITDYDNCTGNIEEKKGIETLEVGEKFVRNIEIEIL